MEPKLIFQWFKSDTFLKPLIEISQELNKCLYEHQLKDISNMDENLIFKIKQSILEVFNLHNGLHNSSRQNNSSKSLCDLLKNGLKSLIIKNENIGKCLSLEVSILK
jgi:hypothetical protein